MTQCKWCEQKCPLSDDRLTHWVDGAGDVLCSLGKPRWLQNEKEVQELGLIQYHTSCLFTDKRGFWYFADEVWVDVCGPYPSQDKALEAVHEYCRHL